MHKSYCFFFYCYGDHRDLHSFPTRRSSDLFDATVTAELLVGTGVNARYGTWIRVTQEQTPHPWHLVVASLRSEEHTSELQSRRDLVCHLLLEKKKKKDKEQEQSPITGRRAA